MKGWPVIFAVGRELEPLQPPAEGDLYIGWKGGFNPPLDKASGRVRGLVAAKLRGEVTSTG